MTNVHPLTVFRDQRKMTMADLARRIGVDRATILRWESGDRLPDPAKLPDICRATGIPAKELRPDLAEAMMPISCADMPFHMPPDETAQQEE